MTQTADADNGHLLARASPSYFERAVGRYACDVSRQTQTHQSSEPVHLPAHINGAAASLSSSFGISTAKRPWTRM